jgi:hypothetical protein
MSLWYFLLQALWPRRLRWWRWITGGRCVISLNAPSRNKVPEYSMTSCDLCVAAVNIEKTGRLRKMTNYLPIVMVFAIFVLIAVLAAYGPQRFQRPLQHFAFAWLSMRD